VDGGPVRGYMLQFIALFAGSTGFDGGRVEPELGPAGCKGFFKSRSFGIDFGEHADQGLVCLVDSRQVMLDTGVECVTVAFVLGVLAGVAVRAVGVLFFCSVSIWNEIDMRD